MRPETILAAALLLAACLLAGPTAAEGLWGRTVLVRVETLDRDGAPLLVSRDYVAKVGEGPEFGVVREGAGGLGVVPVRIDLAAARIDLSYEGQPPGFFADTPFNGYVLTFPAEYALLTGAAIDPAATTLPLTKADLQIGPQGLRLDVAGLSYGPADHIGLVLDVIDCPLS